MLHTIQNHHLSVTVNALGAQLWSIKSADGTQYLWQGDETYWKDRALTIFPYVARLWQGSYQMDGQIYRMPNHGFAHQEVFKCLAQTNSKMVFELCDNENTYAQYPRRFVFRVMYELKENALITTYEVENRDNKTMYFGLGGHPGFNVPLEKGKAFEDYQLRFHERCKPIRVGFSEDCFVDGQDKAYPLDQDMILPLRHSLFDDDAIVLKDMAREVTLEAPGCKRSVTVSFPDMAILGIWHWPKKEAPYVCIEPWSSLPSRKGQIEAFETQSDLIALESGKTYRNEWSIWIG